MRQYIESVHCNGEVKERAWNILDHVSIHDVIFYAKRRNMKGYNRAWRIEENGKIIEAHCDPAFWQYLTDKINSKTPLTVLPKHANI